MKQRFTNEMTAPDPEINLHGELAGIVQAHGGVVDKFLGDGMLAVFGVAGDASDHARRALAAAREIRIAVARLDDGGLLGTPLRAGLGCIAGRSSRAVPAAASASSGR